MSKSETSSGGIGCFSVIGIMFIAMKLLKIGVVANWSWLWVLSPFWIPCAIMFAVLLFIAVIIFICGMSDDKGV